MALVWLPSPDSHNERAWAVESFTRIEEEFHKEPTKFLISKNNP
jgi:hypothetical protein